MPKKQSLKSHTPKGMLGTYIYGLFNLSASQNICQLTAACRKGSNLISISLRESKAQFSQGHTGGAFTRWPVGSALGSCCIVPAGIHLLCAYRGDDIGKKKDLKQVQKEGKPLP